jgi:tetraacyldisaccharide 4'-kinase
MAEAPTVRLPVPVICVGNFVAGGAGKTPTVIELIRRLSELGQRPLVLSRGYGGREAGPTRVDPLVHLAADVGDEPLMLARFAPTVIARDRATAAPLIEASVAQHGISVVLLDDGFQNPTLARDLSIVVVDADVGIGNGRVMPAGPLRAPLASQLAMTDVMLVIGTGRAADPLIRTAARRGLTTVRATLKPRNPDAFAGLKVVAFAGIGRPEKFVATLKSVGARIEDQIAFPDHHLFTDADANRILNRADALGAVPVTTEKDGVRLRAAERGPCRDLLLRTRVLSVDLRLNEGDRLTEALRQMLERWRLRPRPVR